LAGEYKIGHRMGGVKVNMMLKKEDSQRTTSGEISGRPSRTVTTKMQKNSHLKGECARGADQGSENGYSD